MTQEFYVTVEVDQTAYVNVETEKVSEVTAVGIQGPSGVAGNVSAIPDVDTTLLENGSLLVYKTATSKWTSTRLLDLQTLEAGEY